MPLDFSNNCRASSWSRREKRPVTWTLVQNVIPRRGNAKSRRDDARDTALGVAVAKFAHEFANELNVVGGAVHFLEREIEQPKQARNTLEYVRGGIMRLGSLLNELQSLAQAQRLSLQPTRLGSVIEELLAIEEPRYAASGIRVEIDLPPDLPPIRLDASKFRQALLNLCRNAVDAMPHGGSLTLRAYRTDSNVHLDVIDTGEGIPPALDVFALFTTTKPTGMGIGLSIVREIILRHGGTVTYTSEPGTGTTFRLTLPAC